MSFKQRLVVLVACHLVPAILDCGVGTPAAAADSPCREEYLRVMEANEAVRSVLAAQLELERFRLSQQARLWRQGHLTWLAISRQQVLVDSLADHLVSLERFDRSIRQIAQPLPTSTSDSAPALVLHRPGSTRLLGWFESVTDSPPSRVDGRPQNGNPVPETVQQAWWRFKQRQAQYERLVDVEPSSTTRETGLRLKMKLAHAQWRLIDLRCRFDRIHESHDLPNVMKGFAWPAPAVPGKALAAATERLMMAEANATARRDAASVRLQQARERLAVVRVSHANGYLAREEVEQATARLAVFKENHRRLQTDLAAHAAAMDGTMSGHSPIEIQQLFDHSNDLPSAWPAIARQHPSRYGYLIDLRRQYFNLQGQRAAGQHALRWRREQRRRLDGALRSQSEPDTGNGTAAKRDLYRTLKEGQQCELRQVDREIEYLEHYVRGLGQQMSIVLLEERRFIAQLSRPVGRDSVIWRAFVRPLGLTAALITAPPAAHQFMAHDIDLDDPDLVARQYVPQYFAFDGLQLCTHTRRPADASRPAFRRLPEPVTTDRQAYPPGDGGKRRGVENSFPAITARKGEARNRYRLGPSSSHDIYPHGSLRPQLRHRLPAGYPPWYLPGSPTNLQRR